MSLNESGFNIYRETLNASGEVTSERDAIGFTAANVDRYDDEAEAGHLYRYLVTAFNDHGESPPSAQLNEPVERGSLLRALSVLVTGAGIGSVISDPHGISCMPDCYDLFESGASITLTAQPAVGSTFTVWSGACSGSQPTCTMVMSNDRQVSAAFSLLPEPKEPILVTTNSGGTSGTNCTLRDAITAANTDAAVGGCRAGDGHDTIVLPTEVVISLLAVDNSINGQNGLPSITSTITLLGNGSTIQRGGTEAEFRIFHVGASGNLTLENTTVRNGHGGAVGGGGILVSSGRATIIASTVTENQAASGVDSRGAGILNLGGDLNVTSSDISHNVMSQWFFESGPASGGALAVVNGRATITNSQLVQNRSQYVGGIHSIGADSTVSIESSKIDGNTGIAFDSEGSIWLSDVNLRGNWLEQGFAGLRNSGTAYLERITFSDGVGSEFGPRFFNSGYLELRDSVIHDSSGSEYGNGIIRKDGTMHIFNTQILDNYTSDRVDGDAAGVVDNRGVMSINDSLLSGNDGFTGGAIYNSGQLELRATSVVGNTAYFRGAGVFNVGTLTLLDGSSIGSPALGNDSGLNGGGIYAFNGSDTYICATCRITGNSADSRGSGEGNGGGIFIEPGAFVSGILPSTVFGNTPNDVYP
ncbi:MAG: hypothetical protein KF813_04510 [Trueperaceae bacterium]|nr:hypothetical protein [Trueperaceae bacterium]